MRQDLVWASTSSDQTLEHLRLEVGAAGARADGQVVGLFDDRPLRLHYLLETASDWSVRSLRIEAFGGSQLALSSDGQGNWRDAGGNPLPALASCVDIDIQATPFTNTLPVRRLGLDVGASSEISVVYIPVPALVVRPERQRYTRSSPNKYLFEGLESGFQAELEVDEQGLVVEYAGLFERLRG